MEKKGGEESYLEKRAPSWVSWGDSRHVVFAGGDGDNDMPPFWRQQTRACKLQWQLQQQQGTDEPPWSLWLYPAVLSL